MKKLIFILLITFCYSCSNRVVDQKFVCTMVYKNLTNHNDLATQESMSYKVLSEEEYKALLKAETVDMPDPIISLNAKGLCPGKRYNLFRANTLCNPTLEHSFIVRDDGKLVSSSSGTLLPNYLFGLEGKYINGEALHYLLVSEDTDSAMAVTVIPNPIEFRWSDGAYFSLIMLDPSGKTFMKNGYGFKPYEKLYSESTSCDEALKNHFQADAKGSFIGLLLPAVINQTGGNATFTIKRENKDTEVGHMSYYWGNEAYIYKAVKLKPSL